MKNQRQEFLNQSYEKVLDRLVRVFPDLQSLELMEDMQAVDYELGSLSAEDKMLIKRTALQQVSQVYVTGMLGVLLSQNYFDRELPKEELNALWTTHCGTEEFAKRSGLTKDEGDLTLRVASETFLEDLFHETVTVSNERGSYSINKTENGLYIQETQ